MQPNSWSRSKLRVTVQQASLSPLPPPSSLIASVTNTSLHGNSGNRSEYYCKWYVCVYVCYIYAQKITPVVATHFWQTANQNQLPVLKKRGGELALSLIHIMRKCVFLPQYLISYYIYLRAIMSSFKPVHLTLSGFEVGQNPLYNVHSSRILFFSFSKEACSSAGRERLTENVVFVTTLISSESLKLDMNNI